MSGRLSERRAIVTGAARGIGRAVAAQLADDGARVLLVDLDAEALTGAAVLGQPTLAVDLTEPTAGERVAEAARRSIGGIDIVVNNAGAAADAPLHRMSDEQLLSMLDLHLLAPARILRACAQDLWRTERAAPPAKVVNISSVVGTMGAAGGSNYAAAKAGLIGLTKSLAKEWAKHAVCVNAIAFGYIDTRLSESLPERVRERALASIPLGRFGSVAEAAATVGFLCGPASDYVTGQVLTVSGGVTMGMSA